MASKKISAMPELLALDSADYFPVVDASQLPGTPDQANARIKPENMGFDPTGIHAFASAPATPTSTGTSGQWAWDGTFIYFCVGTNTWVRLAPQRIW